MADRPLAVIVTLTLSSLPFADFGTRNDSRAVPPLNDSACFSTSLATLGWHTIFPADALRRDFLSECWAREFKAGATVAAGP